MEWQPIETAPKDGTCFVGLNHNGIAHHGKNTKHGFYSMSSGSYITPTHWMPLPDPPSDAND